MHLRLQTLGNWAKLLDQDKAIYSQAEFSATLGFGEEAKNAVRRDVRASGIRRGGAIANTWRGKGFRTTRGGAPNPAYVLGSNMLKVADQFEKGGTITFKGKGVVPLAAGIRLMRALPQGSARVEWLAAAHEKFGDRLVTRAFKGQIQLGYWENNAGKSRFIALGRIVRSVKSPKLFNHTAILRRAASRFPAEVGERTMTNYTRASTQNEQRAEFGHVQVVS